MKDMGMPLAEGKTVGPDTVTLLGIETDLGNTGEMREDKARVR